MASWSEVLDGCGDGSGGVEPPPHAAVSTRKSLDMTCTTSGGDAVLVNLPHDLAARVFATLPPHARARCAVVCKSWRDMMKELPPEQLWRELDFTTDPTCKVRLLARVSFFIVAFLLFLFFCFSTTHKHRQHQNTQGTREAAPPKRMRPTRRHHHHHTPSLRRWTATW